MDEDSAPKREGERVEKHIEFHTRIKINVIKVYIL